MNETCGCCAGITEETPAPLANRPGLNALAYRVGTHAQFMASMLARLSSHSLTIPTGKIVDGHAEQTTIRPLHALTTRSGDDPAIALLDAWATVADVLTFYQERIANEGYLRTATERRSVLELARLIGYALRPGVASSVYLAFELDQPQQAIIPGQPAAAPNALEQVPPVPIPAGSRAQSVPGPGELPQSFETSEAIDARPEWNAIQPRLARPQRLTPERFANGGMLYLKGAANNLKVNDPMLLNFGSEQQLYRVMAATPDPVNDRTELRLEPWLGIQAAPGNGGNGKIGQLSDLIRRLTLPPSIPPRNRLQLDLPLEQGFAKGSDAAARVVAAVRPGIAQKLYAGWRNLPVTPPIAVEAHALRVRANLFGSSAPKQVSVPTRGKEIQYKEWDLSPPSAPPPQQLIISIEVRASDADPGKPELHVTVQIDDASGSIVMPLPERGSTKETVTIANTTVSYIIELLDHSRYQLTLTFDDTTRRFVADMDLAQGSFAVSDTSSDLSLVELVGTSNVITDVPGAPPLTITARGLLSNLRSRSEQPDQIWLDASYNQITPRSWVALEIPDNAGETRMVIAQVEQASERARADYGISAKSSYLQLTNQQPAPWLQPDATFAVIRGTAVYAQSEKITLADEPMNEPVGGSEIELGMLVDGMQPGRWLIIAGERADIPGVTGVQAAELAMLAGVRQGYDSTLDGDRTHSTLLLAVPLAYTYTRSTVAIYANVAHATHGETRSEVLGSGDGSKAMQQFTLRQSPLTYISAVTPSGVESTLEVRVNDVRWHEVASLAGQGPNDRSYATRTDDDARTTIIFGDGVQGARLPSGSENTRAVYRVGIGKPGNVEAGRITLLASRPPGVKGVNNPLPATGGADRESRDMARENAPLAVTALDRLVSVQDYEDFARTFAGIGKASARRISDGQRQLVHVTIAGADDIPIALTSDLYRNLRESLFAFGDPYLPISVAVRELLILVIEAGVMVQPDYLWEAVAPKIRAALLDTFSFARRRLGQDALLTEVIAAIQSVPGVAYVDVDAFGAIPESAPDPDIISQSIRAIASQPPAVRVRAALAERKDGGIRPAQIALLLPDVEETLTLRRLPA